MGKGKLIKEIFKEQLSNTTGHGLGNIVGTDKLCLKIMWLTAWLVGVAFTVFLILSNLLAYFTWEVITKVRVIDERPMLFPKVTFCNVDPYITNESIPFLAEVIKETRYFNNLVNGKGLKSDLDKVNYVSLNAAPFFLDEVRDKLLSKKTSDKRRYGRTASEFIITCQYDNADCDVNDFEYWYSYDYGNCYTFNTNATSPFQSSVSGKSRGLQVIIYLGKKSEYKTLVPSTGLKVFIGNHSTLKSEEEIVDVAPSTETNIAVFKRITETIEKPYSRCEVKGDTKIVSSSTSEYYDIFKKAGLTYRSADCLNYCYHKLVINACNCLDPSVLFNNMELLNITNYCTLKKGTVDRICLDQVNTNIESCDSSCPFECDSVSYTFSTSLRKYPTPSEYNNILRSHNARYIMNEGSPDELMDELVKVNVYWNSLKYEYISEYPAMTITSLLGGLGGTLGLFLGFSVLSFFEIIEFVVNCCTALKNRPKKSRVTKF